jgi:transcriptional regulator with XRE-family HTH domain
MRRTYRRHLGPKFSEGARLLWARIERRRLSFSEAAELLGWTRPALSNVLYGERLPGVALAAVVAQRFRVPITAWARPASVPFVTPAARGEQ